MASVHSSAQAPGHGEHFHGIKFWSMTVVQWLAGCCSGGQSRGV